MDWILQIKINLVPARRPGIKSRQTPMDFSMCFSASPGGSEPTLNCRSTVSLPKRRLRSQQKKLWQSCEIISKNYGEEVA